MVKDWRCLYKTLVILLLFCRVGVAQPIIDSASITPKPWEVLERINCDFTSIDYKSSGANYTWNFTSVSLLSSDTMMYDSLCASHTCMYNDPALGLWWVSNSIGFVPYGPAPHSTILKKYQSSGIFEGGNGNCAGCIYNAHYMRFPLPLTISTNYSVTQTGCGYCSQYPFPYNSCNSTTTSSYKSTLVSDGYGTLSLPLGVNYPNCLRLMEILMDTNNAVIDTTFFWFAPGVHHQVLEIRTNTGFQVNGIYVRRTWSTAGIDQLSNNKKIEIYPNPTNNTFIINANLDEKLTAKLFDMNGVEVLNKTIYNKSMIDVSELPDGVYSLRIKTENGILNKKLVILH